MSVRRARLGDHWRKVFLRKYGVQYSSLKFRGVRGLGDDVVKFSPGITAIVGGNGVGKTTLAHAISEVLAGADGVRDLKKNDDRLRGSALVATVSVNGVEREITLRIDVDGTRSEDGARDLELLWLDASRMATASQDQVIGDPNFSDVLDGVGQRSLGAVELASASYVVGKDYTDCVVYEIRDYGPFEVWPYFRASCNGVTYGSEHMGRGELALLIALWAIDTAPKETILVLEEPETHVSARSQSALMDLLAWACVKKGVWPIVTTHSPAILQRLPRDNIRLLMSDAQGSRLLHCPNMYEVSSIVGGGVAFKNLLLVEDDCAQCFLAALLERLDPDMKRQCVVQKMEGEAAITAVLKTLPRVAGWTMLVGCYDGDMRGAIGDQEFCWPHVFFPGNTGPDQALRSAINSGDARAALAAGLHVEEGALALALTNTAGLDAHDWLRETAEHLDRSLAEFVRTASGIWLVEHELEAARLVDELRSAISS